MSRSLRRCLRSSGPLVLQVSIIKPCAPRKDNSENDDVEVIEKRNEEDQAGKTTMMADVWNRRVNVTHAAGYMDEKSALRDYQCGTSDILVV